MSRLLALSLALLITGCSSTQETSSSQVQKPKYETYIAAGQAFPLTEFKSISGEKSTLKQGEKRKLVVLFATWCSDSQRTIKQIMNSPLGKQSDLQIVGIGREETPQSLEKFKQQYEINFPLIADPKRVIYSQFANAGVPRLILLDKNNQVVKTLIGEDPNTLEKITW